MATARKSSRYGHRVHHAARRLGLTLRLTSAGGGWISMALIWRRLVLRKGTASALECGGVTPLKRPKRLQNADESLPGRKVDDVSYHCEKCGGAVIRSVPRAV